MIIKWLTKYFLQFWQKKLQYVKYVACMKCFDKITFLFCWSNRNWQQMFVAVNWEFGFQEFLFETKWRVKCAKTWLTMTISWRPTKQSQKRKNSWRHSSWFICFNVCYFGYEKESEHSNEKQICWKNANVYRFVIFFLFHFKTLISFKFTQKCV